MQLLHSSSFCYYGGVFEKEALFSFFYCFCGNCFDECLCDETEAGVCINVKNFILFYLLRLLWSNESTVLGGNLRRRWTKCTTTGDGVVACYISENNFKYS